jgi:Ser/Thr protein kinase RdoA (MazF antagonist)
VIAELLPDAPDESLRIECFAHAAGVPSAEPFPSSTAAPFEQVNGRWCRCHRWIDGSAKQNEDTTAHDAHAMGRIVARLHQLQIPAGPLPPATRFGRDHWMNLARRGSGSSWAASIVEHLDAIESAEAFGATFVDTKTVGSHRDVNAHNVLFTSGGLMLIDWDPAGPVSAVHERAVTATLWAQRRDGRWDQDVAGAFLSGYRDAGGTINIEDIVALPNWLSGLSWWAERNVQISLARPSEKHDQLANDLVGALINGPETVTQRQRLLHDVIVRL